LAQGSVTTDNHRNLRNWAWQADRPITLGALSLVLTLPEGVQVDAMRSRMMDGNFDYHQNGRELRISWYSLEENHKHAGDPLFEMDLSNVPNEGIAPSDLVVEELSEAASPLAEVYDLTTLRIPVIASRNGAECTVYPNPSFGKSLLRLVAPEHGNCTVRIVDAQGRLMTAESAFELTNGINELSLPTEGLADGLYSVQVVYTSLANKGPHGAFIKTLPLTIRK
ncbi:MAG: T9SS type A sorting domain-containing protein, partial [Bacteroidota bacterium]